MKKLFVIIALALFFGYAFKFLPFIYNEVRPLFLYSLNKNECVDSLNEMKIQFKYLGDIKNNQCIIKNAVRINHYPNTKMSSPITMSCTAAKNLGNYFTLIKAKNVVHYGTYNCRQIRRSGYISEHGFGTAIDIASINGASVQKDWNKETQKGFILKEASKAARNFYTNVITPDTNSAHYDHLHLDNGLGLRY